MSITDSSFFFCYRTKAKDVLTRAQENKLAKKLAQKYYYATLIKSFFSVSPATCAHKNCNMIAVELFLMPL